MSEMKFDSESLEQDLRAIYEKYGKKELIDELIEKEFTLDMYVRKVNFYEKRWFVRLYNKIRHAYITFHYKVIRRIAKDV